MEYFTCLLINVYEQLYEQWATMIIIITVSKLPNNPKVIVSRLFAELVF